jgi:hypothetical protein
LLVVALVLIGLVVLVVEVIALRFRENLLVVGLLLKHRYLY